MCLPRCRAPTQLRARPQPSFQTCVTDPTKGNISGEVHIHKVKQMPQSAMALWSKKSPRCTCWCEPSTPASLLQLQQTLQRTCPCKFNVLDQGSSSQTQRSDINNAPEHIMSEVYLVHRSQPFLNWPSSSKDFNLTSSSGIKCCKGEDRFVFKKLNISPVCCTFSCWSQCFHRQADHWRGRIACLRNI